MGADFAVLLIAALISSPASATLAPKLRFEKLTPKRPVVFDCETLGDGSARVRLSSGGEVHLLFRAARMGARLECVIEDIHVGEGELSPLAPVAIDFPRPVKCGAALSKQVANEISARVELTISETESRLLLWKGEEPRVCTVTKYDAKGVSAALQRLKLLKKPSSSGTRQNSSP
jgi:hypothetical protein